MEGTQCRMVAWEVQDSEMETGGGDGGNDVNEGRVVGETRERRGEDATASSAGRLCHPARSRQDTPDV